MTQIEVGKPFPMAYPQQDGILFEFGPDGDMLLIIRWDNPSDADKAALAAGFDRYSLFVAGDGLLAWVWKFPAPIKYIDSPFHSGLYRDDRVQKFLSTNGNMLQVYVIDRGVTLVARIVGLSWDAVKVLQEAVRRQGPVATADYNASVDRLYRRTSEDLFRAGRVFRHGGEA